MVTKFSWINQTPNCAHLAPTRAGVTQLISANCTITFAHRDYLAHEKNIAKATLQQKALAEGLLALSHEALPLLQKVTITGNRVLLYRMNTKCSWEIIRAKVEKAITFLHPEITFETTPAREKTLMQ